MKVNHIIIILVTFVACKSSTSNDHDGIYLSANKVTNHSTNETITIDGNRASLQLRSLLNKSKLKKTELICIQHPDRIELPMRNQPPIIITVENGNLILDDELFKKQVREAFQDNKK